MPTITFRMKMEPDVQSFPVPSNKDTATFAAEVASQRVSWFPNQLLNNRELKDDGTFEISGEEAVYLRDLITSGQLPFVEIVT